MQSAEAVSGILEYLNRGDFKTTGDNAHHDRPLFIDAEGIYAKYAGLRLGSLFQPIVNLEDNSTPQVIAYEALLAAHTPKGPSAVGNSLSTEAIFSLQAGNNEITTLDRLARTLHALNFLLQDVNGRLHLNVHPLHMLAVSADHGQVFEKILHQCGLEPAMIVLEIPEYRIREKQRLQDAIREWQSRGYRIAIDQLGLAHNQFDLVFELKPDIVKIDRTLVQRAEHKARDQETLSKLLLKATQQNVQVIATGVETIQQETLLTGIGFTNLQGYLYGRPAQHCQASVENPDLPLAEASRLFG